MERTRLMSLAMGTAGIVPAVVLGGTFASQAAGGWGGIAFVTLVSTAALGGALAYVRRITKKRSVQARELADRLAEEVARSPRTT